MATRFKQTCLIKSEVADDVKNSRALGDIGERKPKSNRLQRSQAPRHHLPFDSRCPRIGNITFKPRHRRRDPFPCHFCLTNLIKSFSSISFSCS
ncbi:unnamed protein product [Brassica napus]|uniref:(rape) hypothetical protein n=1 Tax=Brassica napus TaxID=3708 RepID=A0A816T1T9_BRANA|nr:unnamed protein product [Brassica napus]